MGTRTVKRLAAVGLLGTMGALLLGSPALATVIAPNTFADENGGGTACSLREAILAANTDTAFGGCPAGGGADTIPLATGIYALSIPRGATADDRLDGDLYVASPLTITHTGVTPAVVDGGGVDRVIHVYGAGNLTASGFTIRNGRTSMSGGGIRNEGNLDLSNATVSGNETTASYGGGIANAGPATMSLTNVTLSGNRAEGDGGAIDQGLGGLANLNHVTIAGNTADTDGDAGGGGGVLVAPGTISNPVGTFNFRNTIIAGNTDISPPSISESPDCGGILVSQGNNLIGDPTGCGFAPRGGDETTVKPRRGPLAHHRPARRSSVGARHRRLRVRKMRRRGGQPRRHLRRGPARRNEQRRWHPRAGRKGHRQGTRRQGWVVRWRRQGQAEGGRGQGHPHRRQGQRRLQGRARKGLAEELLSSI